MNAEALCFCDDTLAKLNATPAERWAVVFVSSKMLFMRRFAPDYVFSTAHGADFFQNVADCIRGKKWLEDCERKGEKSELGERFRRFIKEVS